MPLLHVVILLILIGVGLYLLNTLLGPRMDPNILKIINVVVILVVVLWLVQLFFGPVAGIRVGRL